MASKEQKVLIIGPGFIGWNVLDLLVKENYQVTGFVRRKDHGAQIKNSGASEVVIGDLGDKALISEQAAQHDIIIHTATADDLPSVEAVLDGVQKRADQGQSTIFIHTSGTSVLDDGCHGSHKSDRIYYDNLRSEVDSVPDDAPHRKIDLAIVRRQEVLGDKAKIAIMIPPLIYGFNDDHKRLTIQIPTLTRFALKHGYAGYVGEGLPVESNIHVKDLARGYRILLHYSNLEDFIGISSNPSNYKACNSQYSTFQPQPQTMHRLTHATHKHMEHTPATNLLENPYYFCEGSGDAEPSWREVASLIGASLHRAGLLADPAPRTVDPSLYGDLFGGDTGAVIGLNSRSRAARLRQLGWKAVEKDWRASYVEDELPEILREEGERKDFKGYKGRTMN